MHADMPLTALGAIHQQPNLHSNTAQSRFGPVPRFRRTRFAPSAFGPIAGDQVAAVAARFRTRLDDPPRHFAVPWPDGPMERRCLFPVLLQALRDPELTVRISAATALGDPGGSRRGRARLDGNRHGRRMRPFAS